MPFRSVTTHRFFSDPPWWLKLFSIYVWGDAIWIAPFWLLSLGLTLWRWQLGVGLILIFYFLRLLGEMVYWLLQQFSDRSYHPYDWGFTKLDNHAIYILYQTFSLVGASLFALGIIVFFMKISI